MFKHYKHNLTEREILMNIQEQIAALAATEAADHKAILADILAIPAVQQDPDVIAKLNALQETLGADQGQSTVAGGADSTTGGASA